MRERAATALHTDYSLLTVHTDQHWLPAPPNRHEACAIDHGICWRDPFIRDEAQAFNLLWLRSLHPRGSARSGRINALEKSNFHVICGKGLGGLYSIARLIKGIRRVLLQAAHDKELLPAMARSDGLSAGMSGLPSRCWRGSVRRSAVGSHEFQEILGKGNYSLEIQEHGLDAQKRSRKPLVELAKRTGVPLVATNDAHYLLPEDARAHDVLLCIGSGKTVKDTNRLRYGSPNFYVRSPEEMWAIFGHEIPDALTRTVEIAERCELDLPSGVNYLPNYPIPACDVGLSADEYFEKVVREGYEQRRQQVWDRQSARGELRHSMSDYQERISREIAMIKQMGFAGYFLMRDFDFLPGALFRRPRPRLGRRSLVAYCFHTHTRPPSNCSSRFLNPERFPA